MKDETLSSMCQDFLNYRVKLLFKMLTADQLLAASAQSINQSGVPVVSVNHAVLYFCTIPRDLFLNGTELEVLYNVLADFTVCD